MQAFRGWQEQGEPGESDEPRDDLATKARSILLAPRAGLGVRCSRTCAGARLAPAASSPVLPGCLLCL